jgi:hypothetical protein
MDQVPATVRSTAKPVAPVAGTPASMVSPAVGLGPSVRLTSVPARAPDGRRSEVGSCLERPAGDGFRTGLAGAAIQRFANVGTKDAHRQIYPSDVAIAGVEVIPTAGVTPGQSAVIEDRFERYYEDTAEFTRHTTGQPVACGLIGHLAKWYRLPFGEHFFVLGENHGVVNYRKLIRESNQTGDILGEGGVVPIDQYQPAAAARVAPPTTAIRACADEHPMESVLSKTRYGLIAAIAGYRKQLVAEAAAAIAGPEAPAAVVLTQPPEDWIRAAHGKQINRNTRQIPSYVNAEGRRVYLAAAGPVAEAGYSVIATAIRVLGQCRDAIIVKQAAGALPADLTALLQGIDNILAVLPEGAATVLDVAAKTNLANVLLPAAEVLCGVSATAELARANIVKDALDAPGIYDELRAQTAAPTALTDASSMRDVYMLEAIRRAAAADYLMAGIGDNHAGNLAPALTAAHIPVIRYAEFMAPPYTVDAFD